MGEEYAEDAPFLYFINHGDEDLIRAVYQGRKKEFESFKWKGEPLDPNDINTFLKSKLCFKKQSNKYNKAIFSFYKFLIILIRIFDYFFFYYGFLMDKF